MTFDLRISTGSSTPIFRQIVEQVRLAAAMGTLAAGDALPSVRALAERLVVNPNTIAKAYAELSREGVIEALMVGYAFNVITRMADAFEWDVPGAGSFAASAKMLLGRGYK